MRDAKTDAQTDAGGRRREGVERGVEVSWTSRGGSQVRSAAWRARAFQVEPGIEGGKGEAGTLELIPLLPREHRMSPGVMLPQAGRSFDSRSRASLRMTEFREPSDHFENGMELRKGKPGVRHGKGSPGAAAEKKLAAGGGKIFNAPVGRRGRVQAAPMNSPRFCCYAHSRSSRLPDRLAGPHHHHRRSVRARRVAAGFANVPRPGYHPPTPLTVGTIVGDLLVSMACAGGLLLLKRRAF